MAGRKNNPVRKNNRRNERSRSLSERLVGLLFTTVASGALFAGSFMVRNPVLTGGATAFLVVMGFVSANALWYQPQSHENLFFRTRPELVFVPTPKPSLLSQQNNLSGSNIVAHPAEKNAMPLADTQQTEMSQIASLDNMELTDELPALAANADVEIAKIQQKLRSLGLYDGVVDGLSGPKTRQAIEQWQLLQQKAAVHTRSTEEPEAGYPKAGKENIIQVAVPEIRPKQQNVAQHNIIEKSGSQPQTTGIVIQTEATPKRSSDNVRASNSQPVTSQDIVRVQAGLKAFGNDLIIVDGVAGQSTQDAIREFQKLFDLQITGQVDAHLIGKMREIGLIS